MKTNGKDEKKEETKGPFRAAAVSFGRSPQQFAAKLEEAMNTLTTEGYSIQIMPIPLGMVLLGRQREKERDHPLSHFINMITSGSGGPGPDLPERASNLLSCIEAKIGQSADMEKELPKVMPQVLQGVPYEVIQEVAKEFEEAADAHEKDFANDSTHGSNCRFTPVLRAVAREMRGFAKLNVQ